MFKVLYDFYKLQKPISIYTNYRDMGKFHYGKIIGINENEIAIYMLCPDGNDDGIISMKIENVFRVEEGGKYEEKMKKLYAEKDVFKREVSICQNNIITSLLPGLVDEEEIVSIELNDSGSYDVIGFVKESDDGFYKILQVDEYGFEDGFSYIGEKDITMICFGSKEENRLLKLWRLNKR